MGVKPPHTPTPPHPLTSTLRFSVRDTGPGIPTDQLARLFQPFEQGGAAGKRAEGTGLGLAISQQIVQLMGNRVQVKSPAFTSPPLEGTAGGPGSLFWFEVALPGIESFAGEPPTPILLRRITGYEGARRKVLVVDDRRYNRLLLVDMLEPLGFEVSTAGDGQEAVDKALAWRPDAIIMDLVMPVKTGFEAAQEIRQQPELKEVFIVAASASVLEADQERSRVAGCNVFLPKPIHADDLLAALTAPLNLTWLYAEAEAKSEAPLLPPPMEELALLSRLADEGRILNIRAEATRLEELDEAYVPFARRLQELAKGFEIDQIKAFVKQSMEEIEGE
jgi:CheY-like chemotaxis protein